jgi:hypothetical protein
VELLQSEGDAATIASATIQAAEHGFRRAATDEGVARVTWLLAQLPFAACRRDYTRRLAALGFAIDGEPNLLEFLSAFTDAIDGHLRRDGGRTDLAEMAEMAATETLTVVLGTCRRSLLHGASPGALRRGLGSLATTGLFGNLVRDFFACLVRRHLTFFLSRELSNHVGTGRRFTDIEEHARFNSAIDLHCRKAARSLQDFAARWAEDTDWAQGIPLDHARQLAWVALERLHAELRKGGRMRR